MQNKPPLRLYQINDTVAHAMVPNTFFASKKLAVLARRELNEELSPTAIRFIVSPGPDNKNYKA